MRREQAKKDQTERYLGRDVWSKSGTNKVHKTAQPVRTGRETTPDHTLCNMTVRGSFG